MAARTVRIEDVPEALRIRWRNDFITRALEDWKDGQEGTDLHAQSARDQVDLFVTQAREFMRNNFPEQYQDRSSARGGDGNGGNVVAHPEWAAS